MQVGAGFWPSKTLLTAVELGLFTTLGSDSRTGQEIAEHHDLRSRAVYDFPLAGPASAGIAYK